LLNVRKGEIRVPTSYLQDLPSSFFLALRVAQVKEAKDFLPTSYIQGQELEEAKEAVESARAGLLQKRKKKRKTKEGGLSPQEGDAKKKEKEKEKDQGRQEGGSREGKVPCALHQEILFLVHESLGSERPVSFEYRLL
jgi:hypothetical protein